MKKLKNNIIGILLAVALFFASAVTFAQTQAPPPPGHGTTGIVVPGGGAPIGSGVIILLLLGVAYSVWKVNKMQRKLAE